MGLILSMTFSMTLACGPADEAPLKSDSAPAAPARAESTLPGEDLAALRPSDGGQYRVALRPADGEIPLGRLHEWIFHVETVEGRAFRPSRLALSGGMPQHKHGFVTDPRLTRSLGNGDYLVEGVKFHMAGEWTMRFDIVGPAGGDYATFKVQVSP